jgi:SAM-dependent methyltransferase
MWPFHVIVVLAVGCSSSIVTAWLHSCTSGASPNGRFRVVTSRHHSLQNHPVGHDTERLPSPSMATTTYMDDGEELSGRSDNTSDTVSKRSRNGNFWSMVLLPGHPMAEPISRAQLFRVAVASTGVGVLLFQSRPADATTKDPKTGILLPDPGEIEASIPLDWTDIEDPLSSSDTTLLFGRLDKQPDSIFYSDPRFVEHVDENAVRLMTEYISKMAIQPGDRTVLDLCSSWTSHIDPSVARTLSRISGLGINGQELESNPVLTDWTVQDLNADPRLVKYHDGSFDVVLCQLSIDYLTKPLEVLKEVGRVLKPGGRIHVLFSNRSFLTKAVGLWTGGDDIDHAYYVGCYLHFCHGGFTNIQGRDLSTRRGGRDNRIIGDPLFVVTAEKG